MNLKRIEELTRELLIELGEDPNRKGLLKTPERVAKVWEFLTQGYHQDLKTVVNDAIFETPRNNMTIIRDIEVYSICEHHLLPFFGKCHIGFIAKGRVIGVSKLARIVEFYGRRLQIQEILTAQIADAVMTTVKPEGVGVVMECRHMCMMMRGVEKQNSIMTTSSVLGSFHNDQASRMEFLSLVKSK